MAGPIEFKYPEPVPSLSQLCALPFVASVDGYLAQTCCLSNTRVTLHRVLTRDGIAYLQQICTYAGPKEFDHGKAGRVFPANEGIIGKAFTERTIIRTRDHQNDEEWWENYRADREEVQDPRELRQVTSFLAVPLLDAPADAAVCVLYVEAGGLNVFTRGCGLQTVLGMCVGFCQLFDLLQGAPLPRMRNYPLPPGKPYLAQVNAYPRLQEAIKDPAAPRFRQLTSFNVAPSP